MSDTFHFLQGVARLLGLKGRSRIVYRVPAGER